MPSVRHQILVDAIELHVRVVVRLDRLCEARIELLPLGNDALRLSTLRLEGIGSCRSHGKQQPGGKSREEYGDRRPSGSRASPVGPILLPDRPAGGGLARHKSGSLALSQDDCNLEPLPKSLQSGIFFRPASEAVLGSSPRELGNAKVGTGARGGPEWSGCGRGGGGGARHAR